MHYSFHSSARLLNCFRTLSFAAPNVEVLNGVVSMGSWSPASEELLIVTINITKSLQSSRESLNYTINIRFTGRHVGNQFTVDLFVTVYLSNSPVPALAL